MSIENIENNKIDNEVVFEPKTNKELTIEDAEKVAGGLPPLLPIISAVIMISNKEWQE